MSAKHTPYFYPTTHRIDPCGCSSEGDGTLRDPFHVKRCATHDSGPRLLRENANLFMALEAIDAACADALNALRQSTDRSPTMIRAQAAATLRDGLQSIARAAIAKAGGK